MRLFRYKICLFILSIFLGLSFAHAEEKTRQGPTKVSEKRYTKKSVSVTQPISQIQRPVAAAVPIILPSDRDIIHQYLLKEHYSNCMAKLPRQADSCQFSKNAKKSYEVGQPLARGTHLSTLPDELSQRLKPPSKEYRYIALDKDILLFSKASNKIVDAVSLQSFKTK